MPNLNTSNPFFDESATTYHTFPEDCPVAGLAGHTLELYNELAEVTLNNLETAALTGVTEGKDADGERVNVYTVSAKGMDIENVAAWIKSWTLTTRHGSRIRPTAAEVGRLTRSAFKAVQEVVAAHAEESLAGSAAVVDPTPAASETEAAASQIPE